MLRDMVTSQFANFPLQKLLNEAINYRDENVKNALNKVLDRLSEAISPKEEQGSGQSPQETLLFSRWQKLITAYRKGERSSNCSES